MTDPTTPTSPAGLVDCSCGKQPRSGFQSGSDESGETYGYGYVECDHGGCSIAFHADRADVARAEWNALRSDSRDFAAGVEAAAKECDLRLEATEPFGDWRKGYRKACEHIAAAIRALVPTPVTPREKQVERVERVERVARALYERDREGWLAKHPDDFFLTWDEVSLKAFKDQWRDEARAAIEAMSQGASGQQPAEPGGEVERGWQPIETAPKDGTAILITRSTQFESEEGWHVVRWDEDWWQVHCGKFDHLLRGADPTHWQPLPALPAAAGEG